MLDHAIVAHVQVVETRVAGAQLFKELLFFLTAAVIDDPVTAVGPFEQAVNKRAQVRYGVRRKDNIELQVGRVHHRWGRVS